MIARCEEINGLYVVYNINGDKYIDDSEFWEIISLKKGDIVDITDERFRRLVNMKVLNT